MNNQNKEDFATVIIVDPRYPTAPSHSLRQWLMIINISYSKIYVNQISANAPRSRIWAGRGHSMETPRAWNRVNPYILYIIAKLLMFSRVFLWVEFSVWRAYNEILKPTTSLRIAVALEPNARILCVTRALYTSQRWITPTSDAPRWNLRSSSFLKKLKKKNF